MFKFKLSIDNTCFSYIENFNDVDYADAMYFFCTQHYAVLLFSIAYTRTQWRHSTTVA